MDQVITYRQFKLVLEKIRGLEEKVQSQELVINAQNEKIKGMGKLSEFHAERISAMRMLADKNEKRLNNQQAVSEARQVEQSGELKKLKSKINSLEFSNGHNGGHIVDLQSKEDKR
uniref:Uncharacterized protein n=1 Tax=Clytia hemisphaerica TaxID=252671 RepID=A0A7M5WX80_9CNID